MEDQITTGTKVIAALPADGWYAELVDGQTFPVIGWVVQDDGQAFGLTVAGNGVVPAYDLGNDPDDFVGYICT